MNFACLIIASLMACTMAQIMPYGFQYGIQNEDGSTHARREEQDAAGNLAGRYSWSTLEGVSQDVEYTSAPGVGMVQRVATVQPNSRVFISLGGGSAIGVRQVPITRVVQPVALRRQVVQQPIVVQRQVVQQPLGLRAQLVQQPIALRRQIVQQPILLQRQVVQQPLGLRANLVQQQPFTVLGGQRLVRSGLVNLVQQGIGGRAVRLVQQPEGIITTLASENNEKIVKAEADQQNEE